MAEHGEEHEHPTLVEKIVDKIEGENSSSSSSSDDENGSSAKPSFAHVPPPDVTPEPTLSALNQPPTSPTSSTSSSPSGGRSGSVYRLFGRQQPLHKVLGGGKPADVFLWRDKKFSASVIGVATVIWFLFELAQYHLLTLVSHILIFAIAVLFLWSNASNFINKSPPHIPDVHIPEKTLMEFASALTFEINRALSVLRDIASGKDLKKFLAIVAGLWVVSVVGSWFNFLTLVYLLFVLLHTVPVLYENYEDQVDSFGEKAAKELQKHYAVVDEKVLSKIPKAPLGKKHA